MCCPLNSQKTPHTSPFRASYGVSFMSTSTEIDRVIKGFYCIFKLKLRIVIFSTSCEIRLRQMPHNTFDDESILV